jgi:hypothetical protein
MIEIENVAPSIDEVRRVAIVGTGVIGSGWAAVFAARGYEVTAYVRSRDSELKFQRFLASAWRKIVVRGLAKDPEGWRKVGCVRTIAECVASADYVQESVVEELPLKQAILAEIDEHTPAGVFVGSSTSYIPLSLCRARVRRHPERIAIAHPTLPQWDSFVEVLGATPAHTAWLAELFGPAGVGMEDVIRMRKECHGHVHNAVLNATVTASTGLVRAGMCSPEEMDRALTHMCRLLLASGGVTGALVGVVGGGSADATRSLSADILLGASPAKPIPDALRIPLPELHEELVPTYALRDPKPKDSARPWLLLVKVLPVGTDLDKESTGDSAAWTASPSRRFERLLRETGVPIGVVTAGTSLRLVYAPRGESAGVLTFPVGFMREVAGRRVLAALEMLLSRQCLLAAPTPARLPTLLAKSRDFQ